MARRSTPTRRPLQPSTRPTRSKRGMQVLACMPRRRSWILLRVLLLGRGRFERLQQARGPFADLRGAGGLDQRLQLLRRAVALLLAQLLDDLVELAILGQFGLAVLGVELGNERGHFRDPLGLRANALLEVLRSGLRVEPASLRLQRRD